ncbi:hypothetical protein HDV01_007627 [Terramyces sp. JEL0728]|nr:hypothetical protein HDV01_007627 [Terramyces sp. JEL0728]
MTNLKSLIIYNTKSEHFPWALENWVNLQELIIRQHPRIEEMPGISNLKADSICDLVNLKTLDCQDCSITALPLNIGNLIQLVKLDVRKNRITTFNLPESLSSLSSLTKLYISNNNLSTICDEILELPLLELDVAHNGLNSIPENIKKLDKLQKLFISNNKIEKLPDSICSLANLTVLECRFNLLSALPGGLGQCTKLTRFAADNNHLLDIPNEFVGLKLISYLDLRDNNFSIELNAAVKEGKDALMLFLEKRIEKEKYVKKENKQ